MTGTLILTGGGEFQKGMEATGKYAIELAGEGAGLPGLFPAVVLAVASSTRKCDDLIREGCSWLSNLGAYNCEGFSIISRDIAEDDKIAEKVKASRLIYLVGGDPAYIPAVLAGTPLLQAVTAAFQAGAVLEGSGSGAMTLAGQLYNETTNEILPGLGFVPGACVIPYFGSKGRKWAKILNNLLPTSYLLGLDEKTSIIGFGNNWKVSGTGWVNIYKGGKLRKFARGQSFALNPKL